MRSPFRKSYNFLFLTYVYKSMPRPEATLSSLSTSLMAIFFYFLALSRPLSSPSAFPENRRRASFQSSRSVPGTLATEARSSLRYFNLRSKNAKLRRQAKKQHSEVGIRTGKWSWKIRTSTGQILKIPTRNSSSHCLQSPSWIPRPP